MDISFTLRSTIPAKALSTGKLPTPGTPKGKQVLNARIHEPSDDAECPILQEHIKTTQGLEWFQRPYDICNPKFSAITLPCKHTYHAMTLVYNWARNKNVLCPVCRAGPRNTQLVMCRLPREWRYSLAARVRREWKDDKQKAEEENRQVAITIATSTNIMMQPQMLSFSIIVQIEGLGGLFTWFGHASAIPGAGGLIFQIHPPDLMHIPFAHGDQVTIMPSLLVHPVNFITNLAPTNQIRFGIDDAGPSFFIRFQEETTPDARRRVTQMLYAVNEDVFAQTLANSLFIFNEM